MPVLTNHRHEQFVQHLAKGLSVTRAYASVYGESDCAGKLGSRLAKKDDIRERVLELQKGMAAGVIHAEISNRNARVQAKQNRWDRMRGLIEARAQEMKDVPGGETGMLVRDFKGKDANQVVYKFDASLVNELNKVEKQAAEELGQWVARTISSVLASALRNAATQECSLALVRPGCARSIPPA